MPVQLKFLDINGNEIDLNAGLDLGLSRKGVTNISSFKVQNVGNVTGRDLVLMADTLNMSDEVSSDEYNNQLLAKSWKSFSFKRDGVYTPTLNLGTLKPNQFVEGIKETTEEFISADSCIFKESWTTGVTEFKNNKLILKKSEGVTDGAVARRMSCRALGNPKDVEIEFLLDPIVDNTVSTETDSIILFPVRINSSGNGKGYLFMFQYRRIDNKFYAAIYKGGAGIVENVTRDYGTRIFDIGSYKDFDKTKKLGAKIYNNALGQPTFEIFYDGDNLKLSKSFVSSTPQDVVSDTEETPYTRGGELYFDLSMYDGDISFGISDMLIKTEELEQPIYVKTVLGDIAEDGVEYKSSAAISYIED